MAWAPAARQILDNQIAALESDEPPVATMDLSFNKATRRMREARLREWMPLPGGLHMFYWLWLLGVILREDYCAFSISLGRLGYTPVGNERDLYVHIDNAPIETEFYLMMIPDGIHGRTAGMDRRSAISAIQKIMRMLREQLSYVFLEYPYGRIKRYVLREYCLIRFIALRTHELLRVLGNKLPHEIIELIAKYEAGAQLSWPAFIPGPRVTRRTTKEELANQTLRYFPISAPVTRAEIVENCKLHCYPTVLISRNPHSLMRYALPVNDLVMFTDLISSPYSNSTKVVSKRILSDPKDIFWENRR